VLPAPFAKLLVRLDATIVDSDLKPIAGKTLALIPAATGAWMNPEILGRIEKRGTPITVNAGARQTAQVKLIK